MPFICIDEEDDQNVTIETEEKETDRITSNNSSEAKNKRKNQYIFNETILQEIDVIAHSYFFLCMYLMITLP